MKNIKRIIVLSSLLSGALMVPVVVPHLNASSDVFEFKDGAQIEDLKIEKNAILLSPYTIESLRTLLQDQSNEIRDMLQKEYLLVQLHGQLLEVSTKPDYYSSADKVSALLEKIITSMKEKIKQYESLIKVLDYFSENHPFFLAEKLRQEDKSNMSQWSCYCRDEGQKDIHNILKSTVDSIWRSIAISPNNILEPMHSSLKKEDFSQDFFDKHPEIQTASFEQIINTLKEEISTRMEQWNLPDKSALQDQLDKVFEKFEKKVTVLNRNIECKFLNGINMQDDKERFANYFINKSIQKILSMSEHSPQTEFCAEFYDPTTPRYPDPETPSIVDWERACRFLLWYIYNENTNRDLMDDHRLSVEELYPLLSRVPVQTGMDPSHAAECTSQDFICYFYTLK